MKLKLSYFVQSCKELYLDINMLVTHFKVHVALDEQTVENGCIHYIPGSHHWTRDGNPLPVTDFNFKDMEIIKVS